MLNKDHLNTALTKFCKEVVRQSRYNLTRKDKNVIKELYDSISYDVKVSKGSIKVSIYMNEYGSYQDKGVSGVEKKYNTPFSYKDKLPPAKPLSEWAKARGLRFRDKKGRFITNKATGYVLSRHIYKNGIKPSLFFTKAFNNSFEHLPDDLIEAFNLEVDRFLNNTLNN